eukprot:TRINITY_DN1704_c0_g1_i3.p1 TRINITY_DN1704_c0_g1~~TRINITY_DN1704_c0_g1_i3.p1  ORF type:complete len:250 (-),score=63.14 TRINITY_DN1704_c0_g1_i3:779-1471(-)
MGERGSNDNISMILFGTSARIIYTNQPISNQLQVPEAVFSGTDFTRAFEMTLQVLNRTSDHHTPVVIFMTDGNHNGRNSEYVSYLQKMWNEYAKAGFMFFAVGYGSGVNEASITKIVKIANGGKILGSFSGRKVPFYISCSEVNGLVSAFKTISRYRFQEEVDNSQEILQKLEDGKKTLEKSQQMELKQIEDIFEDQKNKYSESMVQLRNKKQIRKKDLLKNLNQKKNFS